MLPASATCPSSRARTLASKIRPPPAGTTRPNVLMRPRIWLERSLEMPMSWARPPTSTCIAAQLFTRTSRKNPASASNDRPSASFALFGAVSSAAFACRASMHQVIEDAIGQDKDLQTRHDLLISVPGIGTHTAAVILCELPGPEVLRTAREAAAYAGLNPSHRQSGSSLD